MKSSRAGPKEKSAKSASNMSSELRDTTLGGSRAFGYNDASSDWDLGLYYRGAIDLTALAARGDVYPPGSWGRVMNGGAWLRCGGERVDVLLRDLDVVN